MDKVYRSDATVEAYVELEVSEQAWKRLAFVNRTKALFWQEVARNYARTIEAMTGIRVELPEPSEAFIERTVEREMGK